MKKYKSLLEFLGDNPTEFSKAELERALLNSDYPTLEELDTLFQDLGAEVWLLAEGENPKVPLPLKMKNPKK